MPAGTPTTINAANNMANFTPEPQDYSITHLLANTFGEVTANIFGSTAGGGLPDILSTAFAYFNSAVLFFGTVILAYVTVFGVMNTANDGQALGRKWSTVFTPLRIAGSAASLIVTTSGYSVIQLIVLQIVVWGVGIADTTWTNVVKAALTRPLPNAFVALDADANQVRTLAGNMLLSKVCTMSLNQTLGMITNGKTNIQPVEKTINFNLGRGFSVVSDMAAEALGLNTSIVTKIYEYKDTSATPVADGKPICGSVGFMGRTSTVSATTPSVPFSANTDAKKMFVSTGYDAKQIQMIANAMAYNTAVGAYNVLDEKMTVLAADIVSEKPDIDAGRFQEGINAYVRTFRKGYNADINQMDSTHGQVIKNFLEQSTQHGWVQAGMFHRRLSQIQTALNEAYRITPNSKPPMTELIQQTAPAHDKGLLANYALATQKAFDIIANGPAAWESNPVNAGKKATEIPSLKLEKGSDPTDVWDGWLSSMGQKAVAGTVDMLAVPDTPGWHDPVIQVKNIGDYAMVIGETLIAAPTMLKIAARWAKAGVKSLLSITPINLTGLQDVAEETGSAFIQTLGWLSDLIVVPAYGLLYIGYFMSIFLPMVPFMVFTLAVIGWLIAVVESVVAAPLWMVMHMTPESNDSFIGSQQQGYLLLLSVFFKPILTVLGLLLSMIMLRPIMDLVNLGFIGSLNTIQANSTTGIASYFGFMLVYAFITLSVFMTVFALPQDMSDRVLKWISAGIGSLGEKDAMKKIEMLVRGKNRVAGKSGESANFVTRENLEQEKK